MKKADKLGGAYVFGDLNLRSHFTLNKKLL